MIRKIIRLGAFLLPAALLLSTEWFFRQADQISFVLSTLFLGLAKGKNE